ncbi:MAG: hypothetical protein ACM3UY_00790 [Methanocella sp.]
MAELTKEEQKVQAVIDNIEAFTRNKAAYEKLHEKLHVSLEKPNESKNDYSTAWEAIKLFLASVLGAVGGVLIGELGKNWDSLLFVETIAVLFVSSIIFAGITFYLPNWRKKRKSNKSTNQPI